MNKESGPLNWMENWSLDDNSLIDTWSKVHIRFGFAAQEGNNLETALIMLLSQIQIVLERKLEFSDLLEALEKNGGLVLGRLIQLFVQAYDIEKESELVQELEKAKKSRNYLIHHFYRHNNEKFKSPEGCEELVSELSNLQDNISVAIELLECWRDSEFGYRSAEQLRDKIRENPDQWATENEAMLDSIIGDKGRI